MTKRAKRFCKKLMGKGISRNAARLLIDEKMLGEGIRSVHNNSNQKLLARFTALKKQEMHFVSGAVVDYIDKLYGYSTALPETGEADG